MTDPVVLRSVEEVVARVRALLDAAPRDGRVLLGICGAPGSGKSTLAELVVDAVDPRRREAVWVPMDGYHLADVELDRLGRRDRKGAIDTFDAAGYLAMLGRLGARRPADAPIVYAPAFERDLEQPIAGAIPVWPDTRLVVTEGNYLLDDAPLWRDVPAALTEVWFCDEIDAVRRARLVERHVRFGKSRAAAEAWVAEVDEPNAHRILARAAAAAAVRVTLPTLAHLSADIAPGPLPH